MDMKHSLELAVFVIAAIAVIASFLNLLTRERRPEVGYNYRGSAGWDGNSSTTSSDPGFSSGSSGGHGCSPGGSSGDGGNCGGGDGGGGGGGN